MRRSIPIKALPRTGADGSRAQSVRRIVYERALDLFDSKGFRATSMNDIADACGVSKPAIYHYYRNKSHLLETLYEDVTVEFFKTMEALAHSPGGAAARLGRLVETQVLYNIENRRFLTIFWRERHEFDAPSRKGLAAREREFEAWVRHVIEEGQASGEFRMQDPQIAMLAILGLLSTVHRWAAHAGATPQTIATELARLALDGVALRRGADGEDHDRPKTAAQGASALKRPDAPESASTEEDKGEQHDAGGQTGPRHRRR